MYTHTHYLLYSEFVCILTILTKCSLYTALCTPRRWVCTYGIPTKCLLYTVLCMPRRWVCTYDILTKCSLYTVLSTPRRWVRAQYIPTCNLHSILRMPRRSRADGCVHCTCLHAMYFTVRILCMPAVTCQYHVYAYLPGLDDESSFQSALESRSSL